MEPPPPPPERFRIVAEELATLIKYYIILADGEGYPSIQPGLIDLGIGVSKLWSSLDLLEGFIEKSHDHWLQIPLKDRDYFVTNIEVILVGIPELLVKSIAELLRKNKSTVTVVSGDTIVEEVTPVVSNEAINQLYAFVIGLVKISIRHLLNPNNIVPDWLTIDLLNKLKNAYEME